MCSKYVRPIVIRWDALSTCLLLYTYKTQNHNLWRNSKFNFPAFINHLNSCIFNLQPFFFIFVNVISVKKLYSFVRRPRDCRCTYNMYMRFLESKIYSVGTQFLGWNFFRNHNNYRWTYIIYEALVLF